MKQRIDLGWRKSFNSCNNRTNHVNRTSGMFQLFWILDCGLYRNLRFSNIWNVLNRVSRFWIEWEEPILIFKRNYHKFTATARQNGSFPSSFFSTQKNVFGDVPLQITTQNFTCVPQENKSCSRVMRWTSVLSCVRNYTLWYNAKRCPGYYNNHYIQKIILSSSSVSKQKRHFQ